MVGEGPRASRFEYDGNGVDRSLLRLVEFYVFWTITYFLHSRMARTPRSLVWLSLLKRRPFLFRRENEGTVSKSTNQKYKKKTFCYFLFFSLFFFLKLPLDLEGVFLFSSCFTGSSSRVSTSCHHFHQSNPQLCGRFLGSNIYKWSNHPIRLDPACESCSC